MIRGFKLRNAALIAGVGLLIMVAFAPQAELYFYPKFIIPDSPDQTIRNIRTQPGLFRWVLFSYLITFLCDIVVAWALYIFLAPVHRSFSLLAAWFRLHYTAISMFALTKLFGLYKLVNTSQYSELHGYNMLEVHVGLAHAEFRVGWSLAFYLFAVHLIMLGVLVYRSNYIPRIFGILLVIAGLAYLTDNLKFYFFPSVNLDFLVIAFLGEMSFMLWLLVRGRKIEGTVI